MVAVLAYIIASMFMEVFEMGVDTLLMCYITDEVGSDSFLFPVQFIAISTDILYFSSRKITGLPNSPKPRFLPLLSPMGSSVLPQPPLPLIVRLSLRTLRLLLSKAVFCYDGSILKSIIMMR